MELIGKGIMIKVLISIIEMDLNTQDLNLNINHQVEILIGTNIILKIARCISPRRIQNLIKKEKRKWIKK